MMRTIVRAGLVLLAASVVIFNLPVWLSPHLFEQGDLAANALQIERAREFGELLGPYSQHGFHHPGPISFYYFAAAQFVFGFLPSILARHMLGQLVLNLLFLAGILRVLKRAGLEPPLVAAAGLLLAVPVVWLGGGDFLMLANVWGPLLVVFPVVFLVVATSRLALGELDGLPGMILASTIVLHNHLPSSAAVGAVAFLLAVLLGIRRHRIAWTPDGPRRRFLLILSVLLIVLALVPAVVEQIKTDPGNLTLLYRFFSTHGPEVHPWAEVIDKLGQSVTDPLVVLGAGTGWKIHSALTVVVILVFLLTVSVVQTRRSDLSWRLLILFTWVSLATSVIAARTVPGDLHTYLFYYLYGLVGLLHLFVVKEIYDRLGARREKFAYSVVLAGVGFFLVWGFSHRGVKPVPDGRFEEIVSHYRLADVPEIHLFVDKDVENDQVWSALPTLALRFRRDGANVTVPDGYVFLCGEEMRAASDIHPLTLVVTRRRPVEPDERYLSGKGWGTILLTPGTPPPDLVDH
jgi:hypothetical protein